MRHGNQKTHQKNRARLRKRLRAEGVPEDEIERRVASRAAQQADRRQWDRDHPENVGPVSADPVAEVDDRGYRPTRRDPLLHGQARATGQTAAAVKRGKTLTRHEYERREGSR